jgi:hypothetical protein
MDYLLGLSGPATQAPAERHSGTHVKNRLGEINRRFQNKGVRIRLIDQEDTSFILHLQPIEGQNFFKGGV